MIIYQDEINLSATSKDVLKQKYRCVEQVKNTCIKMNKDKNNFDCDTILYLSY